MSTPRQECKCHCTNCCTSTLRHCGIEPCNVGGVAAPLEPSQAINFANQLMGTLHDLYGHTFDILGEQAIVHALDSFAAAVSKNLQEELAALKEHCISEHDCTFCGLESGKSPR